MVYGLLITSFEGPWAWAHGTRPMGPGPLDHGTGPLGLGPGPGDLRDADPSVLSSEYEHTSYLTRAFDLPSEAQTIRPCTKIVEKHVFGVHPREVCHVFLKGPRAGTQGPKHL